MNADRHARIKALFLDLCNLPRDERGPALDRACGDDAVLRREVQSLLDFHDEPEALPSAIDTEALSASRAEEELHRIGPYRVIRKLGEGGMGVVYEVRQDSPIRRKLALKLVKWGMDTGEVLRRFESERQALALMNHPNIAKVFEAGATETGRPYFTMEYVDGEPITRYCDRNYLSTGERLELFMQVCQGVQHAHHNGVIHRDIKSSNVLVRMRDNKPVPTIIDFGVAKATQQRLTERSVYTERGMLIGTPEYMSPEQAEMSGLDVDTRTDVYSLGVVLYELLVGALPFDSRTLRKAGFDEIRRRIREDDPSKPSTRVSSPGEKTTEAARRRRTDPASLRRALSGDMDWITMKALAKDRTRRYETPAEMAADIARHLRHEPVLAGPPGTLYRLGKFVRRHRLGVAAGTAVAATLVVGLVLASAGLVRARRAERAAREEATKATRVSELLVSIFDDMHPGVTGRRLDPGEVLERATDKIETALDGEPTLQARLLGQLGGALAALGRLEQGRALVDRAVEYSREQLPPADPYRLAAIGVQAEMVAAAGDLDRAQQLQEEVLDVRERVLEDRTSLSLGRTLQSLGAIHMRKAEFAEARGYLERSREVLEPQTGYFRIHLANTLKLLGILNTEADLAHEAALGDLQRALEVLEGEFGSDHSQVGFVLFWIGRVQVRLGQYEAARASYEQAAGVYERTLGGDSYGAALAMAGLGEILAREGELGKAREQLERALELLGGGDGGTNPDTAWCVRCLAGALRRTGDPDGARTLLERNLQALARQLGPWHPELTRTLYSLGYLEYRSGHRERARQHFLRTLEITERTWGPGHRVSAHTLYALACLAALDGDKPRALGLLRRALDCGFANDVILEDADLASLRGDPEFEEMVREVGRRLERKAAAR